MSRIGKKPIAVPAKVTVTIDGQRVIVKGPKGELTREIHPRITVSQQDSTLNVTRPTDEPQDRALHGLTRALVNNMVEGVSTGFQRSLTVEGVGYAGEVKGKNLVMKLGYSHEIVVEPLQADIAFVVNRQSANTTIINITGIDKEIVGQQAANIRKLRPPEPYLGKGVRYSDEIIRRKAGKTGK